MRTLAFDGRTGASGDMLLGALVAAGADPDVLATVEERLDAVLRGPADPVLDVEAQIGRAHV